MGELSHEKIRATAKRKKIRVTATLLIPNKLIQNSFKQSIGIIKE